MSVLIKDMEMPKECHGCRWFYFRGTSCTEPKYYLDARCKMVESGQDWYGKDAHGGWIGESIEHIPGWTGYYPYKHCVEMGTRASQCPLCELPSAQPEHCGDAVSRNAIVQKLNKMDRYVSTELRLCDTDKKFPQNEVFIVDDVYEEIVEQLPSVQPKQRWIPVSERLPEEETDVLVTRTFLGCKDGSHGWNNHIPPTTYVEVAQYFNGEWTALSDEYKIARNRHTNPIAWMPLPEPYQEGEQE